MRFKRIQTHGNVQMTEHGNGYQMPYQLLGYVLHKCANVSNSNYQTQKRLNLIIFNHYYIS